MNKHYCNTETETDSETETNIETDAGTDTDTDTDTDADTDTETDTNTNTETDSRWSPSSFSRIDMSLDALVFPAVVRRSSGLACFGIAEPRLHMSGRSHDRRTRNCCL